MPSSSPTNSPEAAAVADVVQRNINDLIAAKQKVDRRKSWSERLAEAFVRFAGTMWFAYLHVAWFSIWIGISRFQGDNAFDPFPFSLLTTIVSLEAIFLTLFVLVSQNQQALHDEQRTNLNLQIDLLAEHEITRILCLVDQIGKKLNIHQACDSDQAELERDVTPAELLNALEAHEQKSVASS